MLYPAELRGRGEGGRIAAPAAAVNGVGLKEDHGETARPAIPPEARPLPSSKIVHGIPPITVALRRALHG